MRKTLLLCFIHGFKVRAGHLSSQLRHRRRTAAAQPRPSEACVDGIEEDLADRLYRVEMIRSANSRLT